MVDYATVQLRAETKRLLHGPRRPGESYDAVIRRKLQGAASAQESAFLDELYAALGDRRSLRPLK